MSYVHRLIEKILRNVSPEEPCDLAQLLMTFDAFDRTMLDRDEVAEALSSLISAKRVMEVEHLRYAGNREGSPSVFTDISEAEHEAAVQEVWARIHGSEDGEIEDEDREWIAVRWVLSADGESDEDMETRASELAEQLEAVLEGDLSGGVLGLELGPGVLEIHIEATDAESRLEPLVPQLVEICRRFGAPAGSTLEWISADQSRRASHPLS